MKFAICVSYTFCYNHHATLGTLIQLIIGNYVKLQLHFRINSFQLRIKTCMPDVAK